MDNKAPVGHVWVCQACGKRSKDKMEGTMDSSWDESCYMWSVLCNEKTIVMQNNRVIKATIR